MNPQPADPEGRAAALTGRLASQLWRVLYPGAASGADNMALDCALLRSASREESPPTLRFYLWAPAAVSLGRFQSTAGISLDYAARRGWDLVRRPTGGRAVLHQRELTYSITLPPSMVGGAGVRTSYAVLTRALNAGIGSLLRPPEVCHREPSPESQPGVRQAVRAIDVCSGPGEGVAIPVERATSFQGDRHGARKPSPYSAGSQAPRDDTSEWDRHGAREVSRFPVGSQAPGDDRIGRAARRIQPNCFALAEECDTLVRSGKLIGSAQVREGGALLQHGSILLDAEPEAWKALFGTTGRLITLRSLLGRPTDPAEVVHAVLAGFRSMGIHLRPEGAWAGDTPPARGAVPAFA